MSSKRSVHFDYTMIHFGNNILFIIFTLFSARLHCLISEETCVLALLFLSVNRPVTDLKIHVTSE